MNEEWHKQLWEIIIQKKKNNWCKSWNHNRIRANQPVYRNKLCFGSVRDSLQNIIISKINCIFLKAESNIITMFFCLRGAFHIPSSRGDQINLLNPLNQTDWNLLVVSWTTDFLFVDVGDITRWVTDQDGVGSRFCPAKKSITGWRKEVSSQQTDHRHKGAVQVPSAENVLVVSPPRTDFQRGTRSSSGVVVLCGCGVRPYISYWTVGEVLAQ